MIRKQSRRIPVSVKRVQNPTTKATFPVVATVLRIAGVSTLHFHMIMCLRCRHQTVVLTFV